MIQSLNVQIFKMVCLQCYGFVISFLWQLNDFEIMKIIGDPQISQMMELKPQGCLGETKNRTKRQKPWQISYRLWPHVESWSSTQTCLHRTWQVVILSLDGDHRVDMCLKKVGVLGLNLKQGIFMV